MRNHMSKDQKFAFLFPGQGSQYVGMGKDFAAAYPEAKETFQEAEDSLNKNLRKVIFDGPESDLTETSNSQVGIFVTSIAILRVIQKKFPSLYPYACSGLSLGEYTALVASKQLEFTDCLSLVNHRSNFMQEACESTKGTMAVILGLSAEAVEEMVSDVHLPNDLWAANFNCPGQVVISGTVKGIEIGSEAAKSRGAKRVLPLQVHGAFHSGLMKSAEDKLAEYILRAPLKESDCKFVMNVPGDFVKDQAQIRKNLIKQVTHPVRWEQGIRQLQQNAIDLYLEIGCGKTLSGLNKKIGITSPTYSIDKIEDLKGLEEALSSIQEVR